MTPPTPPANITEDNSPQALYKLIQQLRSPQGCPWDQKQTILSMVPHLLEETHEVLDAIEHGTPQDSCSELGDLLMVTLFIIDIYRESNQFSLDDVCSGIISKLIRRHPHVFSNQTNLSEREIDAQWEQIKQQERLQADPAETNRPPIPLTLPSLSTAQLWHKKYGTPPEPPDPNTLVELCHTLSTTTKSSTAESILGKLLRHCAVLASHHGLDAEQCLKREMHSAMMSNQHSPPPHKTTT